MCVCVCVCVSRRESGVCACVRLLRDEGHLKRGGEAPVLSSLDRRKAASVHSETAVTQVASDCQRSSSGQRQPISGALCVRKLEAPKRSPGSRWLSRAVAAGIAPAGV